MRKGIRAFIRFLIKTAILAAIIVATYLYVLQPYRISGNQMFPSVRDGDLGFFYKLEECYTNDVVLYEGVDGQWKIGRVVAIGGQTVEFFENGGYKVDGNLTVDEIPYETYLEVGSDVEYPLVLQEDEIFILNDFRSDTTDSRTYGAVNVSQVSGKLLFLLRRRGF